MKRTLLILSFITLTFLSYGQGEYEAQSQKLSKADSSLLAQTFSEFIKAIEQKDTGKIKELSLANINCNLCLTNDLIRRQYNPYRHFYKSII